MHVTDLPGVIDEPEQSILVVSYHKGFDSMNALDRSTTPLIFF